MPPTLRDVAPGIYADLLSRAFDVPAVRESRATCDACPMCTAAEAEEAPFPRFSPSVRCCTYDPPLPNFLVGAILSDPEPALDEGRRRLRARIRSRVGVTPHWVKPAPSRRARRAEIVGDGFGRSEELLCPFYEQGSCTIWRHRDAVCSTYFCRHEGGTRARQFWAGLRDYLLRVEVRLARWAANSVEPTSDEPGPAEEATTDEPLSAAREAELFAGHTGRIETFYVACAAAVRGLDRVGFEAAVDATPRAGALLAEMVLRHRELMTPRPAAHLVLSSKLRRVRLPGGVMVTSDSPWDPVFLSQGLVGLLLTLRVDEPLADAVTRLRETAGVDLSDALIDELRAHEILVTPSGTEGS